MRVGRKQPSPILNLSPGLSTSSDTRHSSPVAQMDASPEVVGGLNQHETGGSLSAGITILGRGPTSPALISHSSVKMNAVTWDDSNRGGSDIRRKRCRSRADDNSINERSTNPDEPPRTRTRLQSNAQQQMGVAATGNGNNSSATSSRNSRLRRNQSCNRVREIGHSHGGNSSRIGAAGGRGSPQEYFFPAPSQQFLLGSGPDHVHSGGGFPQAYWFPEQSPTQFFPDLCCLAGGIGGHCQLHRLPYAPPSSNSFHPHYAQPPTCYTAAAAAANAYVPTNWVVPSQAPMTTTDSGRGRQPVMNPSSFHGRLHPPPVFFQGSSPLDGSSVLAHLNVPGSDTEQFQQFLPPSLPHLCDNRSSQRIHSNYCRSTSSNRPSITGTTQSQHLYQHHHHNHHLRGHPHHGHHPLHNPSPQHHLANVHQPPLMRPTAVGSPPPMSLREQHAFPPTAGVPIPQEVYMQLFAMMGEQNARLIENTDGLMRIAERMAAQHSKPKGLTKAEIDDLPSYRYSTGEAGEQSVCVICMCDFEPRQLLRVLRCSHSFHSKCVDKWLKNNRTCPICRSDAAEYANSA